MISDALIQPRASPRLDLFGLTTSESPLNVALMPIEAIQVHPNGHGKLINLEGLTASVQEHGILQPLIVSPDGRLLAGRRRLEAARRARLAMVPVRVCEIANERAAIEISLIENIERTDLDPLTRARCYQALIEQGAAVEEIAELVGQDDGHVYEHLALLKLHPDVQHAVEHRTLAFADARLFAKLEPQDQSGVLAEVKTATTQGPDGKPLPSRQINTRVDAQRVLRLAQAASTQRDTSKGDAPQGNYAALFEMDDRTDGTSESEHASSPLDDLNRLIAEMIAAAQGEDQIRGWARRLSQVLKALQEAEAAKLPKIIQERLL